MTDFLTAWALLSFILITGGFIGCVRAYLTDNALYVLTSTVVMVVSYVVGLPLGVITSSLLKISGIPENICFFSGISVFIILAVSIHAYDLINGKFSQFYQTIFPNEDI